MKDANLQLLAALAGAGTVAVVGCITGCGWWHLPPAPVREFKDRMGKIMRKQGPPKKLESRETDVVVAVSSSDRACEIICSRSCCHSGSGLWLQF